VFYDEWAKMNSRKDALPEARLSTIRHMGGDEVARTGVDWAEVLR
jgi:hypothetical protein